jgi:hypothetical protein
VSTHGARGACLCSACLQQSVTAICFLVIWDLVLLVYSAWHLLPVYAIATTVATSQPRR